MACGEAASAPSEEGAGAPKGYKGATEGEITRACCLHRGADEHGAKKRSFAFTLAYIKCFRTYSLYLSLRLPAQILYAGIHLPPQREARALPRRAQIFLCASVKFSFDFTVCLYSLHSTAIIIGYYISTLHFHIFLLFSISFYEKISRRKRRDIFCEIIF